MAVQPRMNQEEQCQAVIRADAQCSDKDPKKAVELSIVILVDNEDTKASAPPPPPCPPPCCTPCCIPMPCCLPPCQVHSCANVHPTPCVQPQSRPASSTPYSNVCGPVKPICVDMRTKTAEMDPCGNLQRTQSTVACQTPKPSPPQIAGVCPRRVAKTAICQTQPQPRPQSQGECPEPITEPPKRMVQVAEVTPSEAQATPKKRSKRRNTRHPRGKDSVKTAPRSEINFVECSSTQKPFVQYFLKKERGIPHVMNLAKSKMEYEKSSKMKLANFSKAIKHQARQFFLQLVDAINVPTPDTKTTEIKHYHVMKYLRPILSALNLDAQHESHSIHKYHKYILQVAQTLQEGGEFNPTCLIETETKVLAGFVCRFFPIFVKIKDAIVGFIEKGKPDDKYTPGEFAIQIKKLLLCVYVEIACIDSTFSNALAKLPDSQGMFRQQLALRRKHARHATKWAARSLATPILYYFMIGM